MDGDKLFLDELAIVSDYLKKILIEHIAEWPGEDAPSDLQRACDAAFFSVGYAGAMVKRRAAVPA